MEFGLSEEKDPDTTMIVGKSKIKLDLNYFDKEEIDPDPGLRIFQIVKGKFPIPFKFDTDIVNRESAMGRDDF